MQTIRDEPIVNMRAIIKENRIPYAYLIHQTGYTKCHISRVLNYHVLPSFQFLKLMHLALEKKLPFTVEWGTLVPYDNVNRVRLRNIAGYIESL